MINVAIIGFGNVGMCAYEAVRAAGDMELKAIVTRTRGKLPSTLLDFYYPDIEAAMVAQRLDAAILCLPSRACPDFAEKCLRLGVRTVDGFDIHSDIWAEKCRLDKAAKESGAAAVLAAGWDPGSDSVVRALFESMAPRGLTYTNFGPGMSMGHTVAVRALEGVRNALSITIPAGTGIHKRMVYVELADGYSVGEITAAIKADKYFINDETHVIVVDDINSLMDMGHGVNLVRKGVSANACNQLLEYNMKINNPALTAQIMVSCARAITQMEPGCYTMIEIPLINMLEGDREGLIKRLV